MVTARIISRNKKTSDILLKEEFMCNVPQIAWSCINFSLRLKILFKHLSKWNHELVIKYLSNAFIDIIKEMSFGDVIVHKFDIDENKLWVGI